MSNKSISTVWWKHQHYAMRQKKKKMTERISYVNEIIKICMLYPPSIESKEHKNETEPSCQYRQIDLYGVHEGHCQIYVPLVFLGMLEWVNEKTRFESRLGDFETDAAYELKGLYYGNKIHLTAFKFQVCMQYYSSYDNNLLIITNKKIV